MQVYALRLMNFLRFGEKTNSIVFDLTEQQKQELAQGKTTMDAIYDAVLVNPMEHIKAVKARGIEKLLGITGIIDGNPRDSNGSGKSSIMEGVCYAHYEKIIRKTANTDKIEKAGLAVVTKINGKYPADLRESYVEELFEDNGKIYVIRRGREFSKNQKSNAPIIKFYCVNEDSVESQEGHRSGDTKQAIEEVNSTDYDVFVNSQMCGQNDSGKYLMGTDKVRKETLISLLKLENVVAGCLELLRTRKNAQVRKVDAMQAQITALEEMFLDAYKKYTKDADRNATFDVKLIDSLISSITVEVLGAQADIRKLDKEMAVVEAQIVELSKSDKLVKIEHIKTEGRKLQADKKTKEQEMLSQSSEWDKLVVESQKSLETKQSQLGRLRYKVDIEFKEDIATYAKKVSEFNMDDHVKNMGIIAKAKKAAPDFAAQHGKMLAEKEALAVDIGRLESDKVRTQKELNPLEAQLRNIGDTDKFICGSCKSVVSKAHIEGKVAEGRLALQSLEASLVEQRGKVANKISEIKELEKRINKVNEFILLEPKLEAALAQKENNAKRIDELNKDVVNYQKMLDTMDAEIKELSQKTVIYAQKSQSIKANFEKDIAQLIQQIAELVKSLRQAEDEAKSVKNQIDECRGQQANLSGKRSRLLESIGSLSKEKEHYEKDRSSFNERKYGLEKETKYLQRMEFLEGVFGLDGIQTRIIKKYLPLLNVYTKEFLDILSDGTIGVKMIINDKSKVDMSITGGTADTYEMLSGGEKKVIKLAVAIGMSLLAFSRTAQKPEIIWLDEIFADLDENKTHNAFLMLKRLSDKFSRVIVISHKPDINAKIAHHILVEKEAGKFGLSRILRIT